MHQKRGKTSPKRWKKSFKSNPLGKDVNEMELKPKDMFVYFEKLEEFASHFPLLTFKDVNIAELAKHWGYPPLGLLATVVFMDAMHTLNNESENDYYIDLQDVRKIKIHRRGNKWDFVIQDKEKKKLKIKHVYEPS